MTDPRTLLAEYVTKGSEPAFGELVDRYINLVYATAVRLVGGDTHRAKDVVQTVFSDLARLAGTLPPEVMLGGWLYRCTCRVAASVMRSERRRQNREREAAEMNAPQDPAGASFDQIAPVLDEAISQLGAEDRAALTLRFFEGHDLRAVGEALGSNEDAAQKRVARALEKLRGMLVRRGVTASGAALAAVLSAQSLTAAPAGLAASVSATALAGAAAGSGGLALTALKLMSMAKLKIAVGAVVVASLGTTLVLEQQALVRLREQNAALQAQLGQFAMMAQEHQRLSNLLAQSTSRSTLPPDQFHELLKMRGEVGLARRLKDENPKLRSENTKLRSASKVVNAPEPKEPDDPAEAEFQRETQRRKDDLSQWGLMFIVSANKNNDQSPETWEQVADQIGAGQRDAFLRSATNNYEIVYHGKLAQDGSGETILFRERQPRRSPTGEWFKVYGFADGHTEIHSEPDGNFEAWEQQRLAGSR
jgi:RNA polymerase sigma factor (sigma-70 family)